MKECPICNAKNKNDASYCAQCGATLKDVPATDEWTASDLLNRAKEMAAVGAQKAKAAAEAGAEQAKKAMNEAERKFQESRGFSSRGEDSSVASGSYVPSNSGTPMPLSQLLVDPSEPIIATIGSNYLQNILSGGAVKTGIGVLTDRRVYFKGRNFSGTGKALKSHIQESVVSVDDISLSRFIYTRATGFFIAAIIFLVLSVSTLLVAFASPSGETGLMMTGAYLAAAAVFAILYFTQRKTLFILAFPGGVFAFDIRWYPIADIRDFQRQLHLLKDHRKEGRAA